MPTTTQPFSEHSIPTREASGSPRDRAQTPSQPRPANGPAGAPVDCELCLSAWDQATFTVESRTYAGRPALDTNLRRRLLSAELDPKRYGAALFEGLFPPGGDLLAGYRDAQAIAENSRRRLRLRLHIPSSAPAELHELHWELLWDPRRKLAIGRSREMTFSRFLSVAQRAERAVVERPRVLVVVASPVDLPDYGLAELDRREIQRSLVKALEPLDGELSWEVLDGPATPGRIRGRLVEGGFHVLHLHAHGVLDPERQVANLVLEDELQRASFVEESLFAEIFEGERELRLVTLLACHSGARPGTEPFSGVAPALVGRGIPAIVAMRQALRVDAAALFARHLYRNLALDGRIDQAVNEARQQLYLESPDQVEWGTPALFMQLRNGCLWERPLPKPTPSSNFVWLPENPPASTAEGQTSWWTALLLVVGVALLAGIWKIGRPSAEIPATSKMTTQASAQSTPANRTAPITPPERRPAAEIVPTPPRESSSETREGVSPDGRDAPARSATEIAQERPRPPEPPMPSDAEIPDGRSRANASLVVRNVRDACADGGTKVLDSTLSLLRRAAAGNPRLPIRSAGRLELVALLESVERQGCAGFESWAARSKSKADSDATPQATSNTAGGA